MSGKTQKPNKDDEWIGRAAERLKDLDEKNAFILVSTIAKLKSSKEEITWDFFCELVADVLPDAQAEWESHQNDALHYFNNLRPLPCLADKKIEQMVGDYMDSMWVIHAAHELRQINEYAAMRLMAMISKINKVDPKFTWQHFKSLFYFVHRGTVERWEKLI